MELEVAKVVGTSIEYTTLWSEAVIDNDINRTGFEKDL